MPTEKLTAVTLRETLDTELNALADGARTAVGAEIDNGTNLDRYGIGEMTVTFGSSPDSQAPVNLYAVLAPDGTNYTTGNATRPPSPTLFLGSFLVEATTSAQRLATKPFELPPCKFKIVAENDTGVAFPASGSEIKIYSFNRQMT